MVAAIIILSVLLIGSIAFIFWLFKVLKNTCEIINFSLNTLMGEMPEAYDGKYYPATVISQIKFGCESEMVITDFSEYKSKGIVGFILYVKENMREYIGALGDDISDEILEMTLGKPTVFKNAIVYAPVEGMWIWKSQE